MVHGTVVSLYYISLATTAICDRIVVHNKEVEEVDEMPKLGTIKREMIHGNELRLDTIAVEEHYTVTGRGYFRTLAILVNGVECFGVPEGSLRGGNFTAIDGKALEAMMWGWAQAVLNHINTN